MLKVISKIKDKVRKGEFEISFSHTEKLRARKIGLQELKESTESGEIIEAYPDDPRGPSYLILGFTKSGRPLHILYGNIEKENVLIITAYEPSLDEWEADLKTRKK